jgi:hypothetical protein
MSFKVQTMYTPSFASHVFEFGKRAADAVLEGGVEPHFPATGQIAPPVTGKPNTETN